MDQWLSSSGGPMPSEPPISRSNSSRLVRRASIIANNGNLAIGLPDAIQLPPITAGQVSQFDAAGNEIPLVPAAKVDSSSTEGDSSSNRRRQSDLPLGGGNCTSQAPTFHLVAFPAKDNYEGQLYPLQWIEQVRVLLAQLHCSCTSLAVHISNGPEHRVERKDCSIMIMDWGVDTSALTFCLLPSNALQPTRLACALCCPCHVQRRFMLSLMTRTATLSCWMQQHTQQHTLWISAR